MLGQNLQNTIAKTTAFNCDTQDRYGFKWGWPRRDLSSLFIFFSQRWKNEFLMWNASKYGDTDSVNFAPEEIWVPDIALYNK